MFSLIQDHKEEVSTGTESDDIGVLSADTTPEMEGSQLPITN